MSIARATRPALKPAACRLPEPKILPTARADMQQSRAITRKSASNLALAFCLLPKQKRDAMSALYAFCREVDDVADDETVPVEQRRMRLAEWRKDVSRACKNETPQIETNRELQPVIA